MSEVYKTPNGIAVPYKASWLERQGGNPVSIDGRLYFSSGAMSTGEWRHDPPTNPHLLLRRKVTYWTERLRIIAKDHRQLQVSMQGLGPRFSWDARCEEEYGSGITSGEEALSLLAKLEMMARAQLVKVEAEYQALIRPARIPSEEDAAYSNAGYIGEDEGNKGGEA